MRTILVFLGPCLWSHVLLVFGISRNAQPAAGGHVVFGTHSSSEPAEPEQLSRLRGFASSGLCYTVPRATLSKGLTVEQCNTLF